MQTKNSYRFVSAALIILIFVTAIPLVVSTLAAKRGNPNPTEDYDESGDPAKLWVTLPPKDGYVSYVKRYKPDPWIEESWVLSVDFTYFRKAYLRFQLEVINTDKKRSSYLTRLVIAINDAGYEHVEEVKIDGATYNTGDFVYGTPAIPGVWTMPRHGVYPTWFCDRHLIGTIRPEETKTLNMAIKFDKDAGNDIKIHFDAYGSTVDEPPDKKKEVMSNPFSKDSTVCYYAPPFLIPEYSFGTIVPIVGVLTALCSYQLIRRRFHKNGSRATGAPIVSAVFS